MTAHHPVTVLGAARCRVGESALWSGAEQALYWVDIEGRALHRVDAQAAHRCWALPERIGCIALHAQGGLLAAMETGLFRLWPADTGGIDIAALHGADFAQPHMRFNDGRVDRHGRFWVTSLQRGATAAASPGALYRFAGGRLEASAWAGLRTGNGLAFSPDGRTMYLSDSHPAVRLIWAFDLDDQGWPVNRRLFVDMKLHPGRPDGAAVDADGCYWTCANDAGLIHRFTPAGRLDRSLALPVAKPTLCCFGGPRLDRLYVTSMQPADPVPGYDPQLAGAVLVLNPQTTGLPEPAFAG